MQKSQGKSEFILSNPLDKLKLARKVKLSKITIQGINRSVMFALQNLIPCYDVARLAVNDVNFGDEAVYLFIILNHTYNIAQEARKVKKNFQLFYCTILLRGGPPARKSLSFKKLRLFYVAYRQTEEFHR